MAAATGLAIVGSGLSPAQATSARSRSGSVAEEFKSGAQQVGEGATQIGEGIKQGAIMTWEAIKAITSAAAAKFSGDNMASEKKSGRSVKKLH